jgi:glucosamine--fructose-6-phosphate aminotransferase (isomerizing)
MCGIIGYLGINVYENIWKGLEQLQNRGYDSAGILTFIENKWKLTKYASTENENAIEKLKKELEQDLTIGVGIGHTRWATHGKKTDINAHPHIDHLEQIAIVHNGIIENYEKIKNFLENKGIILKSQTDTEVISCLIGYNLEHTGNLEESIRLTVSELEGTYALCILGKKEKNTIYCIRKGSPLLIGFKNNSCAFVSSELFGFFGSVQKYFILDNNDLCKIFISDNKVQLKYSNFYSFIETKKELHSISPEPFLHWTLKEIMEQPESILKCIGYGSRISKQISVKNLDNFENFENKNYSERFYSRKIKLGGLEKISEKLYDLKHLILLGCGTSYFAGLSVIQLFKKYKIFDSVNVYDASEFYEYHIPSSGKVCVIFISQSGETKDLYDKIEWIKNKEVISLGVINVVDSYIAREMDAGVYLHIGREVGVASTKAFTAQVVCLTLIMLWFLENKMPESKILDEYIESILFLPRDIQMTIEKNHLLCKCLSENIKDKEHLFLLAKEENLSFAFEGSLKLKEIGYIHAEAYSSGALKHGPYALIEKDTPVILLCPKDEHFSKHQSIKEEIICRGGNIIGISDTELDIKFSRQMIVPKNKHFFGVLSNILIQLLAYELSLKKNINPDMPRNLAKVVTVD